MGANGFNLFRLLGNYNDELNFLFILEKNRSTWEIQIHQCPQKYLFNVICNQMSFKTWWQNLFKCFKMLIVFTRDWFMRFLMSGFLHESIVPIPLSNILKYFRKYFWLPDNNTRKSKKWSLVDPIFFTSNHKPRHVPINMHRWFLNICSVLKVVQLFKNKKNRIIFTKFHFRGTIPGN